jgi:hypothetical protein
MRALSLTPEQKVEGEALFARVQSACEQEARQLAQVRAGKEDRQRLGGTEFEIRERGHRLGVQVGEEVRRERKKVPSRGADGLSALPGVGPVGERAEQGEGRLWARAR